MDSWLSSGEVAKLFGVRARDVTNLIYNHLADKCELVNGNRRIPQTLLPRIHSILENQGKHPKSLPSEYD